MTAIGLSVTVFAVWIGAWIAGLDLTIRRDYFAVPLAWLLMALWRIPLMFWSDQCQDSWNPVLFWLVFTGFAWVLQFLFFIYVVGRAMGGSFKQSLIVTTTVIALNLIVPFAMRILFG